MSKEMKQGAGRFPITHMGVEVGMYSHGTLILYGVNESAVEFDMTKASTDGYVSEAVIRNRYGDATRMSIRS